MRVFHIFSRGILLFNNAKKTTFLPRTIGTKGASSCYTLHVLTGFLFAFSVQRGNRFPGFKKGIMKLSLISALILAYAVLAAAWISQSNVILPP